MSESPERHEVGLDLVMPFVVCQSQGGPYADDAFAAGFAAGQLWTSLAVGQQTGAVVVAPGLGAVRRPLLPQAELIAMHFGYRWAEQEPTAGPPADWAGPVAAEWVFGAFEREAHSHEV